MLYDKTKVLKRLECSKGMGIIYKSEFKEGGFQVGVVNVANFTTLLRDVTYICWCCVKVRNYMDQTVQYPRFVTYYTVTTDTFILSAKTCNT